MVNHAEHGNAVFPLIRAGKPQGMLMGYGIERVEEAKAPR